MTSPAISLCMIVKDEAYFLPRCLEHAAAHVDEIVLVDTGSSDNSKEIAAGFGAKVFDFEWCDDFSAARNFSLGKATGDWIVVLDADEIIDPQGWHTIRQLIADTRMDAFFLEQRNYTHQRFEGGWRAVRDASSYTRGFEGYKSNSIARLFRNLPSIRYCGHVHEVVDPTLAEGRFEILDVPIHHHGEESPSHPKEERQKHYLRLMERDLDSDPSGRLYNTAASIRMHYLKDYPTAVRYYSRAVELGWRPNESREGLALARYLAGDLDAAYADYRSLYEEGHSSVNQCINLANLAVKRDEKAFAADLLERAIAHGVVDAKTRMSLEHNIRFLRG